MYLFTRLSPEFFPLNISYRYKFALLRIWCNFLRGLSRGLNRLFAGTLHFYSNAEAHLINYVRFALETGWLRCRVRKKLDLHVQFPAGQRTHVGRPPTTGSRCCSARVQRMERISNVIGVPFYIREAQLLSRISMLLWIPRQGCKTRLLRLLGKTTALLILAK